MYKLDCFAQFKIVQSFFVPKIKSNAYKKFCFLLTIFDVYVYYFTVGGILMNNDNKIYGVNNCCKTFHNMIECKNFWESDFYSKISKEIDEEFFELDNGSFLRYEEFVIKE